MSTVDSSRDHSRDTVEPLVIDTPSSQQKSIGYGRSSGWRVVTKLTDFDPKREASVLGVLLDGV